MEGLYSVNELLDSFLCHIFLNNYGRDKPILGTGSLANVNLWLLIASIILIHN